jgi:hypothetical protein
MPKINLQKKKIVKIKIKKPVKPNNKNKSNKISRISKASSIKKSKSLKKQSQPSLNDELNKNLTKIHSQINKITKNKLSKLEKLFDEKAENISSANLSKFKDKIKEEKHDFRTIAAEVMNKEIDKLLNNDEKLSKLISKYQKLINESADRTEKIHKEFKDKFSDELNEIKNTTLKEAQLQSHKQLVENTKKQQELSNSEFSKLMSANKNLISNFEKEIITKEKALQIATDKKLEEKYTSYEEMLSDKYAKYYNNLLHLKLDAEKEFKLKEKQFNESFISKFNENIDKEFKTALSTRQKELNEHITTTGKNAVNKINTEFNEELSKYKKLINEQSSKTIAEYALLREKFAAELKSEEENNLSKTKDLMRKELSFNLTKQRELLDKELTKTVLSNQHFVEQFKKEINAMTEKLTDTKNKIITELYAKNKEIMSKEYDPKLDSLKKLIEDTDITNKKSKLFIHLTSEIQSLVKDTLKKEFGALVMDERKVLESELRKAETINKNMEKKFEGALQEKAQELIKTISDDANIRFSELMSLQQNKLEEELSRAKKSYDIMEDQNNEIIKKTNSILGNISTYSSNKLKKLEHEHNKHLKKVSQITAIINRAESALNNLKTLKVELDNDKKNASKNNKEYSQLIAELTELKNSLAQEKNWIAMYRAKVNMYNLIRKCNEYVKLKNISLAKLTYNKIADIYAHTPFEKKDKAEMYNAAVALSKEIQELAYQTLDKPS